MKPTITAQEANEMMYNLSIRYMENVKYHMESLENIRPEDEYTPMDLLLATIKVAKVLLVKMEALASFAFSACIFSYSSNSLFLSASSSANDIEPIKSNPNIVPNINLLFNSYFPLYLIIVLLLLLLVFLLVELFVHPL